MATAPDLAGNDIRVLITGFFAVGVTIAGMIWQFTAKYRQGAQDPAGGSHQVVLEQAEVADMRAIRAFAEKLPDMLSLLTEMRDSLRTIEAAGQTTAEQMQRLDDKIERIDREFEIARRLEEDRNRRPR